MLLIDELHNIVQRAVERLTDAPQHICGDILAMCELIDHIMADASFLLEILLFEIPIYQQLP